MLREGNRNWELSPPGPRQGLPSGTRSPGGSHMLRQVTRGQRSLTDSHITAVAEAETTKTRQSSFDVSAPGDAGSSPPHRLTASASARGGLARGTGEQLSPTIVLRSGGRACRE